MSSKRRLHLGIDYGTSMSKIVFRDYGAPGGEAAVLVLRNGSFRIPSRLCATAAELLFGDDRKTSEECDIYESLKMRAAVEFSGDPSYYFGPDTKLPMGFTAADLSTLSVWFLISEGYKAIADYLDGRTEGINLGMTMGIPMAFFQNPGLRSLFLRIAQRAWLLYRGEGPVGSVLLIERAIRLLQKYPDTNIPTIPEYEIRDWVRSEGEAAMWWPFQSPAVRPGPYAKIDIGAGTTHASLYRIYGDTQTPKRGLAFFGAATVAVGMDAMDRAIAESQELGGDCLSLRGLEKSILDESGKARGATIPVREHIYEAYRKAWIETYRKINHYHAELDAWASLAKVMLTANEFLYID